MQFFGKKTPREKKPLSKSCLFFVIVFVVSIIGVELWQFHWPKATIRLQNTDLYVLVARTPDHWHRGLGRRESLAPYDGMIFLFPSSRSEGFVMRDMQFPLDIIWLDRGVVVDIAPNVPTQPGATESQLQVYYPRKPGNIVLELPAGWATAHGLKIGDLMTIVKG